MGSRTRAPLRPNASMVNAVAFLAPDRIAESKAAPGTNTCVDDVYRFEKRPVR